LFDFVGPHGGFVDVEHAFGGIGFCVGCDGAQGGRSNVFECGVFTCKVLIG
jgi:hypothetical protein